MFKWFPRDKGIPAKIRRQAEQAESFRAGMAACTDEELAAMTEEFRGRLAGGLTLDDILPEAFAAVREAARRVLGMEHFHVQMLGGAALHYGYIAQMYTGEGKTLTVTLPAYLNALEGRGVHVITVNDYLARRDAEWMGKVYGFLGLSTGVVVSGMQTEERKAAYACDITYVTNSELGFDYLRDHMAKHREDVVLRGLHYAVIDEADSVLIDEARTPLIISDGKKTAGGVYELYDRFVKGMTRGRDMKPLAKAELLAGKEEEETGDFMLNEKDRTWAITSEGTAFAESFFGIDNYAAAANLPIRHGVDNAVKANYFLKRDRDYIVKDGEVQLVDPFTGRILDGHRFSDGLHQALEAKEGLRITIENGVLATITYQCLFNKYERKCGATGTAATEKDEFLEVYGLDVAVIPPNRPVRRTDMSDIVYRTKNEKYASVIHEIIEARRKGQPVLVGTASIEVSELLSERLTMAKIPHNVLNAKNHEKEALIVAEAGKAGTVTIATDMAGRGTDIKPDSRALEAGGLFVIGTERHESRRIDDQLCGRSGRQGDPGKTRFYLSLEDDLLRLFGGDRCAKVFDMFGVSIGEGVSDRSLSRTVRDAQKRMESESFAARKNLLEYDRVLDEQRDDIYRQRTSVLCAENMDRVISGMVTKTVSGFIDTLVPPWTNNGDWDFGTLNTALGNIFFSAPLSPENAIGCTHEGYKADMVRAYLEYYRTLRSFCGIVDVDELMRNIILSVIDEYWAQYLDGMEVLLQNIGLQAYASRDPVLAYRETSYDIYNTCNWMILIDSLTNIFLLIRKDTTSLETEDVPTAKSADIS